MLIGQAVAVADQLGLPNTPAHPDCPDGSDEASEGPDGDAGGTPDTLDDHPATQDTDTALDDGPG